MMNQGMMKKKSSRMAKGRKKKMGSLIKSLEQMPQDQLNSHRLSQELNKSKTPLS